MILSIFLLVGFLTCVRSVDFSVNPSCHLTQCTEIGNSAIFYGKNNLENSSVHLIFSSFGELTLTLVETEKNAKIQIDYEEIFQGNFSDSIIFLDGDVKNIFSSSIRRLIEFNDVDDSGRMNETDPTAISYSLINATTNNETFFNKTTSEPKFSIPLNGTNGTLTIEIIYPGQNQRDSDFPKLKVLTKSFFLNLILEMNDLKFNRSRFLFELDFYVSSKENFDVEKTRFIDDQFTPGIFNVYRLKPSNSIWSRSVLWKPVAYLTSERSIEANTLLEIYDIKNNVTRDEPQIFDKLFIEKNVAVLNFSVGHSDDGFFTANNFSFVQFAIGLEEIPLDETGLFVTVSVIGSFALPVIIGFLTLIIYLKRRFSNNQPTAYREISN